MMKIKRKRINSLKLEIEKIEETIEKAEKTNRPHFAKRLRLIKEKKLNVLNSWISNS